MDYKTAGVDVVGAGEFVRRIGALTKAGGDKNVISGIGGFGALYGFDKRRYRRPVLVSSCDGVGTKLKIAALVNRHDTVGIDLVAMSVNDLLCCGARPLFFLDYIACGKLNSRVLTSVVRGIRKGCGLAGCSLVGGETAEMPGMYARGSYDLAGFCVGVVERDKIIDGTRIECADTLIGLASSGLHSNGFSLARKVFSLSELKRYSRQLLRPTRIYVKPILFLLRTPNYEFRTIKGIAHITGGGFYEKITRIIPKGLGIEIEKGAWPIPGIFHRIQKKGDIPAAEMFRTFNMGIGLVLVTEKKYATRVIRRLYELGVKSWPIGKVVKGRGVRIVNSGL
ncbi:MAG: phosphoribosylformylglycinamidine cyclo-ligase [Candidatus Omnitrophota bacterium]